MKSRPVPGPMMPEIPLAWATRIVPWVMLNCGPPGFGVRIIILRLVSLKLFEALPATNQETCVRLFSAHLPAKPKGSHSFFLIFHQKLKKPCAPRVPRSATVDAEGVKDGHSHNWDAALSEKVSRSGCPQPAGQFQDEGQPWCRCSNFCQVFFKHTYKKNK